MSSILAAYDSKYGSTQEVAEAIATEMHNAGIAVTLEKVRNVKTLRGYSAIVLGALIFIGAWHKDTLKFLPHHHQELEKRPIAVFALGPTQDDEQERQESRAMLDKELAKFPRLAPAAVEMFGGKFDPNKLRFPDSLSTSLAASPLHNSPPSDVRDWTAIRTWASNLKAKLQLAMTEREWK